MKTVFTLASLLVIAGCASGMQWDKPGVSRAQADADARRCSLDAETPPSRSSAQTTAPAAMAAGPSASTAGAAGERDTDRQLLEASRMQNCMRALGYDLKPR